MALDTGPVRPQIRAIRSTLSLAVLLGLLASNRPALGEPGSATSLEDIAAAWMASDEAQALAVHGAAEARAARVNHSLLADAGLELRREQGELGGEAFTTSFLGASAELDWTGRSFVANRAGERGAEAAALQTRAGLLQGACDVAGLALTAEANALHVAILQTTQARLDELVRILDGLAGTGGVSAYELARAQGEARQHRLTLLAAQAGAADDRAAVLALTGSDGLRALPEPKVLPGMDQLEAQAAEHAPALRAAGLEAESRRLLARAEGLAWAPSLEIYGGLRQDEQGILEPGQGFEAGARIGLPGFDGGHRDARNARASQRQAEAEQSRTEARLRARLAGLHAQGLTLRQEQAAHAVLNDLWPAARERYLAGEADLTELLDVAEQSEGQAMADVTWRARIAALDLDLSCTTGTFAQPILDSHLESTP